MGQYFNVVDGLLVIQRLPKLQVYQISKVGEFEIINYLCLSGKQKSIDAA